MKPAAPYEPAFSLVEVVLSLAVVSFALLTVLALLPLGVSTGRDTLQQTAAAGIAAEISSDFRVSPRVAGTSTNTPRFDINYAPSTTSLFFGDDGSFSTSSTGASLYRATVTVSSTPANSADTVPVRILVTWPGLADPSSGQGPINYVGAVDVTTAVNLDSP